MNTEIFLSEEEKGPLQCKLCHLKFPKNQSLKNHIALVHEGKKPFECSICNQKFGQKGHFNVHIKTFMERIGLINVAHVMLNSKIKEHCTFIIH